MSRSTAVLYTLAAYLIVMGAIALWATLRTQSRDDFFLGGRRLGPWLAALSASASSSSAWTLLGVSGAAYAWGLQAFWLLPSILAGYLINWFWVGPHLQSTGHANGSLTLTEWLVKGQPAESVRANARLAASIVLVSFMFYIAAQLNAAGHAFHLSLGIAPTAAVVLGAGIVLIYTLLGGFWAASATDALQGLVMLAVSLLLPTFGLLLAGGFEPMIDGLGESIAGGSSVTGGLPLAAASLFIVGTMGIGLGYPGQPHVVNRYLALRDLKALRRARVIAIVWIVVVLSGMLILGWSSRVLFGASIDDPEQALFELTFRLFAPAMAGVVIAAVLSAIMSTADSQLLVAASSVSHDWQLPEQSATSPWIPRLVVAVLTAMALLLAIFLPQSIFDRVLFAWHALGSAFGPAVILTLVGRRIAPRSLFNGMLVGFVGTVVLHWFPNTTGDWAERLLPLIFALVVTGLGSSKRQ